MSIFKSIKSMIAEPKIRVLLVFLLISGLIALGIAFTGMKSQRVAAPDSPSQTTKVTAAPQIESVPGVSTSTQEYASVLHKENIAAAQKALQTGTSFVPTPEKQQQFQPALPDLPGQREQQQRAAQLAAEQRRAAEALRQQQLLAQMRTQQQAQAGDRQRALQAYQKQQAEQSDLQGKMADKVLAAWQPQPQALQFGVPDPKDKSNNNGDASGASGATAAAGAGNQAASNPANSTTSTTPLPLVKAGDIMFGVAITGVNSDEPGPIMARIVSGKFKGAKLIGSFTLTQNAKLVLEFNTINLPDADQSYAVNAVAVDPDTARTALATSANHHYILRYGTFFAANFLSGFAQAIALPYNALQGAAEGGGVVPQPPPPLDAKEKVRYALGQVGTAAAQHMNFLDTPPTVKVASGTPMGILFQSDFSTGTPPPKVQPITGTVTSAGATGQPAAGQAVAGQTGHQSNVVVVVPPQQTSRYGYMVPGSLGPAGVNNSRGHLGGITLGPGIY